MKLLLITLINKYLNNIWANVSLSLFKGKRRYSKSKSLYSIIIVAIFFGFNINSIHAFDSSDSTSLKVWVDFIEESDTAYIKGLLVNLGENKKEVKWEMEIHRESATSLINDKKNGEVIIEPFFPQIISEIDIDLKKREYFVIVLNVLDSKNELLATDTLISTDIDPTLKKVVRKNFPIVAKPLSKPRHNLDALEIDGLILDETRTKVGRDFYEILYNKWTPPMGARDYLITIKETPSRGIGASLAIEVNGNIILYRFVQPRGGLIEQEANITIAHLKQYLKRNENLKQDLEFGDQLGSGVF